MANSVTERGMGEAASARGLLKNSASSMWLLGNLVGVALLLSSSPPVAPGGAFPLGRRRRSCCSLCLEVQSPPADVGCGALVLLHTPANVSREWQVFVTTFFYHLFAYSQLFFIAALVTLSIRFSGPMTLKNTKIKIYGHSFTATGQKRNKDHFITVTSTANMH